VSIILVTLLLGGASVTRNFTRPVSAPAVPEDGLLLEVVSVPQPAASRAIVARMANMNLFFIFTLLVP
jgi:hypothetical protein